MVADTRCPKRELFPPQPSRMTASKATPVKAQRAAGPDAPRPVSAAVCTCLKRAVSYKHSESLWPGRRPYKTELLDGFPHPPPCHGAIRNFVRPVNADLLLSHILHLAAKSCYLKSKVDGTLAGGKPFLPVNLKNADLDLHHWQMQHTSLTVTCQRDPV